VRGDSDGPSNLHDFFDNATEDLWLPEYSASANGSEDSKDNIKIV
jgi:hypothetical protein